MSTAARDKKRKALVIDADEGFLAFAAEALNAFRPGFDVATAKNPKQASDWLETFSPDLVVVAEGDETLEAFARELMLDGRVRDCRLLRSRKPVSLPSLLEEVRSAVNDDH